jgi:hypothetical protein
MFNGQTLLATVDQQTASGVATGTAKTRYVHPGHPWVNECGDGRK